MMMCSRCKKRPAVMFISTMSANERKSEGLCIKCAKELGLPQVNEYLQQMGISEDDFDSACESLFGNDGMLGDDILGQFGMGGNTAKDGLDDLDETDPSFDEPSKDEDDLFERGGAGTMPNFLKNLFGSPDKKDQNKDADEKKSRKKPEKPDKRRKCLETFCTNLTRRAKEGKIDSVIGRDKEIYRVLQILSRRTKNNPGLIGEPGVGKTAIAEGIALRLSSGDVPFRLQGKELYLLDLTALVAGTQFRGQFESRVKSLIDEVKNAGNVMLFVDEVHNLVGTGGDSEGSMNAANIFKPALSRGELQVIGATTFSEYRKHIEKDSALERRFQPVTVNEPSIDETIEVLGGIKGYYEEHHKVHVTDEIVRMCAVLSERYITDRFLPDKAIDLLDESCACASLENESITEYEKLKAEIKEQKQLQSELAEEAEKDYERLAELKTKLAQNEEKIEPLKEKAENVYVSMDDLSKVIELWTGIPEKKIK